MFASLTTRSSPLPTILGHEAAGTVEAVGELVTRRQPVTAINQCFADMKAGSVARSVIVFE